MQDKEKDGMDEVADFGFREVPAEDRSGRRRRQVDNRIHSTPALPNNRGGKKGEDEDRRGEEK